MSNPLISSTMRLQFGELNITPRVFNRLHELDFTVPELEAAIAEHKSGCDGEPSVYVGTYGKYNEGSLRGLWIDFSSFDDYDEFINFCQAFHANEPWGTELMEQDFDGSPRDFYNEVFLLRKRQVDNISCDDFDNILQYSEMCEPSAKTL